MNNNIERRFVTLRAELAEDSTISGYAAVFDQPSQDLGGFIEVVRPGAFTETIKNDDVRALWNHDSNYVLGRTKNNTLTLIEDERGLYFTVKPPNTNWAADAIETIKRGDVDQMSFGFQKIKDVYRTVEGQNIRELIQVDLYDVSPVTFPAYPQTSAEARDMVKRLNEEKSAETQAGTGEPEEKEPQARRTLRAWLLDLLELENE